HTFAVTGVNVPSGVSTQPITSRETLVGATNRLHAARERVPDADFWVGIEGGVEQTIVGDGHDPHVMEVFAWIVVEAADGTQGMSRTGSFYLPEGVVKLVVGGLELGHADDQEFGRTNSKHQTGTVGLLTDDRITRQSYYEHAVLLALIPLKNSQFRFALPTVHPSYVSTEGNDDSATQTARNIPPCTDGGAETPLRASSIAL
ncbi:hypothetical protein DYB32_008895, partial [Aphanomyces invadans]